MTSLRPLTLVKLGGSLITDKTATDTVRSEILERLAREISEALPNLDGGLLIGHGSGSFGHVAAHRLLLAEGLTPEERRLGAGQTQAKARELHQRVMDALLEAGVPAFSISPSSVVTAVQEVANGAASGAFNPRALALALTAGMVPVVYGDVILRSGGGAVIFSTETIFAELLASLPGRGWGPRRILWLGGTDGVYGAAGETLAEVSPDTAREALDAAGAAAGTDVTGGMAHRLESALAFARQGVPSSILDGHREGLLRRALEGDSGADRLPGTRVTL